jgi:hypothetical protein
MIATSTSLGFPWRGALLAFAFATACSETATETDAPRSELDGGAEVQSDAGGSTPEPNGETEERSGGSLGRFTVTLTQGTTNYATFDGKVYEAPVPQREGWKTTRTDGDCSVREPERPSCDEECVAPAYCAAGSNVCATEPPTVSAGEVTVSGLITSGAKSSITLTPLNPTTNAYNATGENALSYPPFQPGDEVVLAATGEALGEFTMVAHGIEPLMLDGEDPLTFTSEDDLTVAWAAGTEASAVIELTVDISFHGGTKGQIVCETDDDGELVVSQALVSHLIELGVAGFPQIEIIRRSGSFANVLADHIEFNVLSRRTRLLSVPGVVSCADVTDCADGEDCREDSTCG